jgi:hypothetical protein
MKLLLATTLALITLPALAQTPPPPADSTSSAPAVPPPSASSMANQITSTLTPAEKTQLMDVRMKTMAANPDLQTEEMGLMQKGMALQSGGATDADKMAFRGEVKAHADKVRAAMVKLDPTIEPVLAKIEAQIAKMRTEYQAPQ